jgi:uncharacterized protein (DUF1697 family)
MNASTFVALLRGINVGGKNTLPMKDLIGMFAAAGCKDVRTYLQSGNVIFNATRRVVDRLPDRIAARIEKEFGYRTPVVIRTLEQLAEVATKNPFLAEGAAENSLHVLFLADAPSPSRIATLDPDRSSPDAFLVRGREVFLHLPNGMARTKLTNAYFDAKLATTSTGRNWRTVTMILGIMLGQHLGKQAEA